MLLAHWKAKLAALFVLMRLDGWRGDRQRDGAGQRRPAADCDPAVASPAETRALDLYDAHDCWRDKAPADMRDQVPGHVVVTNRPAAPCTADRDSSAAPSTSSSRTSPPG